MTGLEWLEKVKQESSERTSLVESYDDNPELLISEVSKLNETPKDWYKYELSYILNLVKNIDIESITSDIITEYKNNQPEVVVEKKVKPTKHIVLYADEFRPFVWEQYSKILGFSKERTMVKLYIDSIE